jgi:dTDP-4-dehydrorhamnose 3,5-epimerase
MKELPVSLPGVRLFEIPIFRDDRGFFIERWNEAKWTSSLGFSQAFVQDNHSRSRPGVLRGLHYQLDPKQGKLVSCLRGRVFDVAVDLRAGSKTFGEWFGTELSEENGKAIWIPHGFAHGFCVLGDELADVVYKVTGAWNPKTENGLIWNDPKVGIEWPLKQPILSPKDIALPGLESIRGI